MLINNASIVNKNAPLWKVTAEEFENVMNVNVNGVVNVIRAFVPAMVARKAGMIINMSSSWGEKEKQSWRHIVPQSLRLKASRNLWHLNCPIVWLLLLLDPGGSISTPMLYSCAPQYVNESPTPEMWSQHAIPYILKITIDKNGASLTCPECT